MEEICNALSAKLSEAGTGVYAVFYEDELLDCLPESARDRDTLEAALKKLNSGGYIDVRYARGSAFCLSFLRPFVLEQPENEAEPAVDVTEKQSAVKLPKRAFLLLALCSFLGGLAGGLCILLGAVI